MGKLVELSKAKIKEGRREPRTQKELLVGARGGEGCRGAVCRGAVQRWRRSGGPSRTAGTGAAPSCAAHAASQAPPERAASPLPAAPLQVYLIYIEMLGHDTSWAQATAIQLCSDKNLAVKKVGGVGLEQMGGAASASAAGALQPSPGSGNPVLWCQEARR